MVILSQVNLLHETESIGRALVARVEGHSEGFKLVFMSTTNRGDVANVSLNEAMALLRSKRSGCREAPKKRSELGISNAHLEVDRVLPRSAFRQMKSKGHHRNIARSRRQLRKAFATASLARAVTEQPNPREFQ